MIEQQRYKKNSSTAAQKKKYRRTFRPRFSYQVIQREITVKNRGRTYQNQVSSAPQVSQLHE